MMHKYAWYSWCIYDVMVYKCFDKNSAGCAVTRASKSAIKSEVMHSRQLAEKLHKTMIWKFSLLIWTYLWSLTVAYPL